MKWVIMLPNNNKDYFFKELDAALNKVTWTSDPMKAHLFTSSGAAEFYAVKNNIKSTGIKRIGRNE